MTYIGIHIVLGFSEISELKKTEYLQKILKNEKTVRFSNMIDLEMISIVGKWVCLTLCER